MKTTRTAFLVLVLCLGLLVSVSPAHAQKPLDVDCDVLANTIVQVDAFLDSQNVPCNNLGDLLSNAITDPAVFSTIQALIFNFSGGTIFFSSPTQTIATIAKCKQMSLLVAECAD